MQRFSRLHCSLSTIAGTHIVRLMSLILLSLSGREALVCSSIAFLHVGVSGTKHVLGVEIHAKTCIKPVKEQQRGNKNYVQCGKEMSRGDDGMAGSMRDGMFNKFVNT
jgi:hypothetical protein